MHAYTCLMMVIYMNFIHVISILDDKGGISQIETILKIIFVTINTMSINDEGGDLTVGLAEIFGPKRRSGWYGEARTFEEVMKEYEGNNVFIRDRIEEWGADVDRNRFMRRVFPLVADQKGDFISTTVLRFDRFIPKMSAPGTTSRFVTHKTEERVGTTGIIGYRIENEYGFWIQDSGRWLWNQQLKHIVELREIAWLAYTMEAIVKEPDYEEFFLRRNNRTLKMNPVQYYQQRDRFFGLVHRKMGPNIMSTMSRKITARWNGKPNVWIVDHDTAQYIKIEKEENTDYNIAGSGNAQTDLGSDSFTRKQETRDNYGKLMLEDVFLFRNIQLTDHEVEYFKRNVEQGDYMVVGNKNFGNFAVKYKTQNESSYIVDYDRKRLHLLTLQEMYRNSLMFKAFNFMDSNSNNDELSASSQFNVKNLDHSLKYIGHQLLWNTFGQDYDRQLRELNSQIMAGVFELPSVDQVLNAQMPANSLGAYNPSATSINSAKISSSLSQLNEVLMATVGRSLVSGVVVAAPKTDLSAALQEIITITGLTEEDVRRALRKTITPSIADMVPIGIATQPSNSADFATAVGESYGSGTLTDVSVQNHFKFDVPLPGISFVAARPHGEFRASMALHVADSGLCGAQYRSKLRSMVYGKGDTHMVEAHIKENGAAHIHAPEHMHKCRDVYIEDYIRRLGTKFFGSGNPYKREATESIYSLAVKTSQLPDLPNTMTMSGKFSDLVNDMVEYPMVDDQYSTAPFYRQIYGFDVEDNVTSLQQLTTARRNNRMWRGFQVDYDPSTGHIKKATQAIGPLSVFTEGHAGHVLPAKTCEC